MFSRTLLSRAVGFCRRHRPPDMLKSDKDSLHVVESVYVEYNRLQVQRRHVPINADCRDTDGAPM